MKAETVISALAERVLLFGGQGGSAHITGSILKSPRTEIHTGAGASFETQGNGHIRQNSDGSISFHA
jgi:hypothetical protein